MKRKKKVAVKRRQVRTQLDGAPMTADSRVDLAAILEEIAAVRVRLGVLAIELDGSGIQSLGIHESILPVTEETEVVVSLGVTGIERDRRLVATSGFIVAPKALEHLSEIVPAKWRVGSQCHRALNERERGVEVSRLHRDHAEQIQRVRVLRLKRAVLPDSRAPPRRDDRLDGARARARRPDLRGAPASLLFDPRPSRRRTLSAIAYRMLVRLGEAMKRTRASSHCAELRERGFCVIPNLVPASTLPRIAAAYDRAFAEATPPDLHASSSGSNTRLTDLVNRGAEFDDLYLLEPVLEACASVIGAPSS